MRIRAGAYWMPPFSELRSPGSRVAKVFSALLALVLFAVISIAGISGFLLHQILHPPRNPSNFDLDVMMGHPTAFSFTVAKGGEREGWFFPGLRGAPVIVVCHGYGSQRSDVLTLVTALQEHGLNVYLFDFSGHGTSVGSTTLGYSETGELRAAIQALAARDDVDAQHFGLWGEDMGGYAALEVAASDPRITALVVDDAYADPRHMLQLLAARSGLTALPLISRSCDFGFRMLNYPFRHEPPVSAYMDHTKGIAKLFIESDDHPDLANETLKLYTSAPEPKQLVHDAMSYFSMSDEYRKTYENQIVSFFLQSLPSQR